MFRWQEMKPNHTLALNLAGISVGYCQNDGNGEPIARLAARSDHYMQGYHLFICNKRCNNQRRVLYETFVNLFPMTLQQLTHCQ